MISVRIVSLPGCNNEYMFEEPTSVADALEHADITLDAQSEIKVNGEISNTGRMLNGGEQVIVSKKVKGNVISVRIVSLPGCNNEYMFDEAISVADALEEADITLDAQSEIKVNGEISNTGRMLNGGEQVIVSKKVKGNVISVRIVSLPGCNNEYMFDSAVSVADALEHADITLDAQSEIKVNGEISNTGRMLNGGEQVIVSKKVKGND